MRPDSSPAAGREPDRPERTLPEILADSHRLRYRAERLRRRLEALREKVRRRRGPPERYGR